MSPAGQQRRLWQSGAALCLFLGLFSMGSESWGQEAPPAPNQDVKIDQIIDACVHTQSRDEICSVLVQLQQIGNDAIEAIKTFVHPGPAEYALLTAANFATTGRLRFQTKSLVFKDWDHIVDYRSGAITLSLERNF